MDRVKERLTIARRALATLFVALGEPKTPMNRDASIQRFEYCFETAWKAVQVYLAEKENLELASPNSVIRGSFQVKILTDPQSRAALAMARDRNLTVHSYNEELAEQIYARIPGYADLLDKWLAAIE